MTRQEERHHAAIKEFPRFAERRVGFIAGAEWADKTMIGRACEWLNAFLASHYVMRYHDSCEPVHEFILEGFKRAMEE